MSTVTVKHGRYESRTYIDGVHASDRDTVTDQAGVTRWLAAASYFNDLVEQDGQPPEKHEKLSGGVIKTTRFNPAGVEYVTIFTPTTGG